jgi:hypothetical protein
MEDDLGVPRWGRVATPLLALHALVLVELALIARRASPAAPLEDLAAPTDVAPVVDHAYGVAPCPRKEGTFTGSV